MTPLLLLLTFSIVDFACLFYVYLALENGASQATRYAVTGQVQAGMTREQSIKAAMRTATPTLTLDDGMFSFSHLPPGGTSLGGRDRRRERHREAHDQLHLEPHDAAHPAVLHGRSDQHPSRVGHEERAEVHQ